MAAPLRLIVTGAGGRMGRSLVRAIAEAGGVVLVGALEAAGSSLLGQDAGALAGLPANGIAVTADLAALAKQADALIDFTIPTATVANAKTASAHGLAHVIGTTGLAAQDHEAIRAAAKNSVIVQSGNMSLGVNVLAALVKRVAKTLDEAFDIEILEMHHNRKIDAPSGTALLLGEAAAKGRGVDLAERKVAVREGHTGARRPGDIGFATLRGGTVIGEHSVIFAGADERIELSHKAQDRMIFAHGAVKAASWTRGQKPGLYSMMDVLGLKDF